MDKLQFIEQYGSERFDIVERGDIFVKAQFGGISVYALAADSMLVEGQPLEQICQLLVKCEGLGEPHQRLRERGNVLAFPIKEKIAFPDQDKSAQACT